jgi:ankyrin repeat protein
MTEVLLEAGANPNLASASGETPLLAAARTGDVGVAKLLMMGGAEVETRERRRQQTPLMWAVSGGHRDVVRLLIETGADVNATSGTGFTPLMFAARQGDVDAARMLISAGADVQRAAADGATALMVAAGSLSLPDDGRERTAITLLDHGADPNTAAFGYTVLHLAVATGKPDLVRHLLTHGANPNARAIKSRSGGPLRVPEGATPFWLAAKEINADLMRALAAAGADATSTPADRTTALMAAAGVGQVEGPRAKGSFASPYRSRWDEARALEAVGVALDLGGEINAVNAAKGWSALHGAAHIGADQMVQFLVAHGAALDVPDKNGQTPLSLASEGARDQLTRIPHKTTADLLVKLGAMPAEPTAPSR